MKHFFLLFTALIATTALGAADFEVDGIDYNFLGGDSVAISSYHVFSDSVTIPAIVTYNSTTYRVTSIEEYALSLWFITSINVDAANTHFASIDGVLFNYAKDILIQYPIGNTRKEYSIPNSVDSIGNDAFAGCDTLESVTFPDSITIGAMAFSECNSLRTINFGNRANRIGRGAFSGCPSLTTLTISSGVTHIDMYAFSGCTSLRSVYWNVKKCESGWLIFNGSQQIKSFVFGDSVQEIPKSLCSQIASLTTITISKSVQNIESLAFELCVGADSIVVPNTVLNVAKDAFRGVKNVIYHGNIADAPWGACSLNGTADGCFIFTDTTKKRLCCCLSTAVGTIEIPNSVDTINYYAFAGCKNVTAISIPNSVTKIGGSAFEGCIGLKSIVIPNSVTYLGRSAFQICSNLNSITLSQNLKSIQPTIFSGCENLTSITIPNGVTSIGRSAFFWCTSLKSITIPNSVTSIGLGAFYYCWSLPSITIPSSVTKIEERAFALCDTLASIIVDKDNKHYASIDGVLFDYNKDTLIQYPFGNPRTSYTIPEGVTRIGVFAFYKQYMYQSSLTSITIPNSVTSIGYRAFFSCNTLSSITCYAVTPPTCGDGDQLCFEYVDKSIPLYVPEGSIDAYKAADGWRDFTNIQAAKESALESISFPSWENRGKTSKFIRNGQLFILRDGKTYNALGAEL